MKKLILVVLAVFFLSGIASAETTMTMSGHFRISPEANNYGSTGSTSGAIPPYLAAKNANNTMSNNFVDQRARLYFNIKSNESVGGFVALEIDSLWGGSSFANDRTGTGGGLGTDTTNIEVKNSNMWFKPMANLKITAGTQTWGDDMNGIFAAAADTAGFRVDYALSKASSLSTGAYIFWNQSTNKSEAVYMIPLTVKQQIGSGTAAMFFYTIQDNSSYQVITNYTGGRRPSPIWNPASGATSMVGPFGTINYSTPLLQGVATATPSAQGFTTNYETAQIYHFGLNYSGKAGNVSYFVMGDYNWGKFTNIGGTSVATSTGTDADISAFAANAKVDVKIGNGNLKLHGLYVTGTQADQADNSKFRGFVTVDHYQGHNSGLNAGTDLAILIGNSDQISNATFLAPDVNNNGDGIQLVYGAFDYNLSPKLNAKAVLGYATADKLNQPTVGTQRAGKGIGTEYNAQLKYLFNENLTIAGVAAYAQIGDYFNTSTWTANDAYKLLLKFIYIF